MVPAASSAGIWDTIKDAITGHTTDVIERVTVADAFAPGNIQLSNNFREGDPGNDLAHWVTGTAQLVRDEAGKEYIQLQGNFKAGAAPDLYIYVSEDPTKIVDEATFFSTEQLELSKLSKGSGASYYELPEGFDAATVTIWCKRFSQFMGSVNFKGNLVQ